MADPLWNIPVRVDERMPKNTAIVSPTPIHEMLVESGVPREFWEDEVKRMVRDGRIVVLRQATEEGNDAGTDDPGK